MNYDESKARTQAGLQSDSYPTGNKNVQGSIIPNPYPTVQPPYIYPSQPGSHQVYSTNPAGTIVVGKAEYDKLVEYKHKVETIYRLMDQAGRDDHMLLRAIEAVVAPNV
jgi:hypothetical protein